MSRLRVGLHRQRPARTGRKRATRQCLTIQNRGRKAVLPTKRQTMLAPPVKAAGLSQTEAATLVHVAFRTWQQWEAGDRRMHPAFWELLTIKIGIPEKIPSSS